MAHHFQDLSWQETSWFRRSGARRKRGINRIDIEVGVLALPIWGFFAPGQQPPYNYFGWILLGLIAISVAWAVYVMVTRPQSAATLGTMIADE